MNTDSSVYAFVDDFIDAGVDDVVDELARKGFSSVSLATVYHAARDLLPHNPQRAVAHRTEGVHYFAPDVSLYTGVLKPRLAPSVQLEDVVEALTARNMSWQAWTVYFHNCRLASEHPELAVTNAFGDRYITDLCPSSTDAATYAVNLTADVARLNPSLIVAESLHHTSFGHGYHHERAFVELPEATSFLLSLCFCDACGARAGTADVDARALAEHARVTLRQALTDPAQVPGELDRHVLAELCGETLLDYLAVRERTVAALAAQCAAVARERGARFGFMDQTGAAKGYVTGQPRGKASSDDAWQLGIAPARVMPNVDSYLMLAYAQQPARVRDDVRSYVAANSSQTELRCVLRHGRPDYLGAANLEEKVRSALECGADAVDFYHYGLMPVAGLDAASAALRHNSAWGA